MDALPGLDLHARAEPPRQEMPGGLTSNPAGSTAQWPSLQEVVGRQQFGVGSETWHGLGGGINPWIHLPVLFDAGKGRGGGGGWWGQPWGTARVLKYLLWLYLWLALYARSIEVGSVDDPNKPLSLADLVEVRRGEIKFKRDQLDALGAERPYEGDLSDPFKGPPPKKSAFDQLAELAVATMKDVDALLEFTNKYLACEKSTEELIDFLAAMAAKNLQASPGAAYPLGLGRAQNYVEHLRRTCHGQVTGKPRK